MNPERDLRKTLLYLGLEDWDERADSISITISLRSHCEFPVWCCLTSKSSYPRSSQHTGDTRCRFSGGDLTIIESFGKERFVQSFRLDGLISDPSLPKYDLPDWFILYHKPNNQDDGEERSPDSRTVDQMISPPETGSERSAIREDSNRRLDFAYNVLNRKNSRDPGSFEDGFLQIVRRLSDESTRITLQLCILRQRVGISTEDDWVRNTRKEERLSSEIFSDLLVYYTLISTVWISTLTGVVVKEMRRTASPFEALGYLYCLKQLESLAQIGFEETFGDLCHQGIEDIETDEVSELANTCRWNIALFSEKYGLSSQ